MVNLLTVYLSGVSILLIIGTFSYFKKSRSGRKASNIFLILFAFGLVLLLRGFFKSDATTLAMGITIMYLSMLFMNLSMNPSIKSATGSKPAALMQKKPDNSDEEMARLFAALDRLLEKLPAEEIEKFAKTEESKIYRRVMDRIKKRR